MRVVEGHCHQKLRKKDFVRQLRVKSECGSLCDEFGQHSIYELVECEVFVSCDIKTGYSGLQHFVRPADLPKDESGANLVGSGCHDLTQLSHIYTRKVTLNFKHWAHVYPEASGLFSIFNTVC